MLKAFQLQTWFGILLVSLGGGAQAQSADEPLGFAKRLVSAINSGDSERRKELAHPRSLVCVNGEGRSFFEDTFSRQAAPAVPANYRASVKPRPRDLPLLFADKFDYPVHPTHQLQIDFETGPYRSKTIAVQIAHDGKQWREVWACPKPETLRQMRVAKEASAKEPLIKSYGCALCRKTDDREASWRRSRVILLDEPRNDASAVFRRNPHVFPTTQRGQGFAGDCRRHGLAYVE